MGANRSVAHIHALLYPSERPLPAEDIADTLGIARSNVFNSLRELIAWKRICRVQVRSDRWDHYEAETDLWQMVTRIGQGHQERGIDPAVAALSHVVAVAQEDRRTGRLAGSPAAMQDFVLSINHWYEQILTEPPGKIVALIKLGARTVNLLGLSCGEGQGGRPDGLTFC